MCSDALPVLRKAFLTYVRPILEYASNVWTPYLIKHINALESSEAFHEAYPFAL